MWDSHSPSRLLIHCLLCVVTAPLVARGQTQDVTRRPLDSYEIQYYSKARPVTEWSPSELMRAMPELGRLAPSQSQERLPAILQQVGNNVARFFRQFPNTTSVEEAVQEVLRPDGMIDRQQIRKFHYLILATRPGGEPGLEEYRTDAKGRRLDTQAAKNGFLLTQGFAAGSIFFDRPFQRNCKFRYLGREKIDKRTTDVVAFAQNPKARPVVEVARIGNQSAVVLVQGVAWIDQASDQIIRLRTELLSPPPLVDLERQTTEIDYEQVRFKEAPDVLWLPRHVVVTSESNGQAFRNLSTYSKYELFRVNTKLRM
jgi:hypothetical protein